MNAPKDGGGLPRGELLGRYRTYEDAQKVVGHLASAEGFEVKKLTIVGNDLRSVEHIRSRLTYPKVAGAGAAQGAMFGVFIGLLLMLFTPEAPLMNLLFAVVLGIAVWMIIGVVGFSVRRGRREFASTQQLVATTYDVVCDFSAAGRARQLVAGAGVPSLNQWNDPTGRSRDVPQPSAGPGTHSQAHAETPAQGASDSASQPEAEPPDPGEGAASSSTGYESLPDGRPRYGVRLGELQESAEAEQHTQGEPAQEEPQPEDTGPEQPAEQERAAHRPEGTER